MINAFWTRQLLSGGCRTLEAEWREGAGKRLPAACPAELSSFLGYVEFQHGAQQGGERGERFWCLHLLHTFMWALEGRWEGIPDENSHSQPQRDGGVRREAWDSCQAFLDQVRTAEHSLY